VQCTHRGGSLLALAFDSVGLLSALGLELRDDLLQHSLVVLALLVLRIDHITRQSHHTETHTRQTLTAV
jgi:hypothetical protein